jgi:hypothetical protein
MAISRLRALQQFVIREFFKDAPTGVMRTLPNQELVDVNVQVLAQRLMQGGIDPTTLKNANQVENALNMIESRPPVQQGIRSTGSAKVFDMEGQEIPKGSKIMGGKAVKETEAEILERIKRENKEAVERMRNKKFLEDYETSEAKLREKLNPKSTTSLDDPIKRVYEREKKEGKFENIRLRDGRKIESEEDFREYIDELNEDSNFAQGGRAGFKDGPLPIKKDGFFISPDFSKMTPEEIELYKLQMERMKKGFEKKLSPEGLEKLKIQKQIREQQRKDMGLPEGIQLLNKGGRAGFNVGGAPGPGAPSIKLNPKAGPMGPAFETDDPKEAAKEIIRRLIRVEGAQIPLTKKGLLGIAMPSVNKAGIGGLLNLLGGELDFGAKKDFSTGAKDFGFRFRKEFGGGKDKRANKKEGGSMTRRTFLKILGGLASIPIVGKILKPVKIGKTVSKVPVIKTAPVEGKPEWFDSLVNKVIVEGDDVTKRFATGERQTIHQKTLDDGSVVRVTEDADQGAVRVEYESSENVFGDPVQMEYKRPLPDEATPDPAAEFTTAESGPVGRQSGPEDYEIDIDEVGGTSIRDLDSDVSKLKEYATGKKPTIKEMMQNKRRKDKAAAISEDSQAQSDAVVRRQGDFVDDDFSPDFASGGIAGMLGE